MKNTNPKRGMTILEMLMTVMLSTILIGGVFALTNVVNKMLYKQTITEDMKNESQRALRSINTDLLRTKKFYQRASPFLSIIPTSTIPPVLAGSTLPRVSATGSYDPGNSNFSSSDFGNQLLFIKIENSADFRVGAKSYNINLYRIVHYYVSPDTTRKMRPYNHYLTLVRWESELFADYWELKHLYNDTTANNMSKIRDTLSNRNIRYCLDVTSVKADSAFYRLNNMNNPITITANTYSVRKIVKTIDNIIGISFNKSDSFPVRFSVPTYATSSGKFPSGFEVAVVGPTSSRRAYFKMVLAGWTRDELIGYENILLVSAPEI